MQNPWLNLPTSAPYVLDSDAALLQKFQANAAAEYRFDLSLFPEPFFGSSTASVVVLNLNPGLSPDDAAVHAQPHFAEMSRLSLGHNLRPYPFLHLQPKGQTPGGSWWRQRTRHLESEVGFERLAARLGCIQYVPYHSCKYKATCPWLPSQDYSLALVRQAMAREAEIVVLRARSRWHNVVPELATYRRVHYGINARAAYLTPGNLKSSYAVIAQRLRGNS